MAHPSQLDVWLIDLERYAAAFARLADIRDVLDLADRRRLSSYGRPADAMAFAASRAGLDQVLRQFGATAGTRLRHAKSGKPFAPGLPAFSLSRTRGYAAIAVNPSGGIGIDIETVRPIAPGNRLIVRVAAMLTDRWPADRRSIAAWTVIEAWTKLHGLTLAQALDSPACGRNLEAALAGTLADANLAPLSLPADLVGHCWFTGQAMPVAVRELRPDDSAGTDDDATPMAIRPAGPQSYPNALA